MRPATTPLGTGATELRDSSKSDNKPATEPIAYVARNRGAVTRSLMDGIAVESGLELRVYPEIIRRVFWGIKRLGIGSRGRRAVPIVVA